MNYSKKSLWKRWIFGILEKVFLGLLLLSWRGGFRPRETVSLFNPTSTSSSLTQRQVIGHGTRGPWPKQSKRWAKESQLEGGLKEFVPEALPPTQKPKHTLPARNATGRAHHFEAALCKGRWKSCGLADLDVDYAIRNRDGHDGSSLENLRQWPDSSSSRGCHPRVTVGSCSGVTGGGFDVGAQLQGRSVSARRRGPRRGPECGDGRIQHGSARKVGQETCETQEACEGLWRGPHYSCRVLQN